MLKDADGVRRSTSAFSLCPARSLACLEPPATPAIYADVRSTDDGITVTKVPGIGVERVVADGAWARRLPGEDPAFHDGGWWLLF